MYVHTCHARHLIDNQTWVLSVHVEEGGMEGGGWVMITFKALIIIIIHTWKFKYCGLVSIIPYDNN